MDKALYKLSHGMYVLTTKGGGCIVDAVCQISAGNNPLISIAVMKTNNTNTLLKENDNACLSIIGENTDKEVIKVFDYHSMRNFDKFAYEKLQENKGLYFLKIC